MSKEKGFAHLLLIILAAVTVGAVIFLASNLKDYIPNDASPLTFINEAQKRLNCENNPNPTFDRFPVDLEHVTLVSPPIMQVATGIKSHSYISIDKPVPVYAPVDSTITRGAKYTEDYVDASKIQYTLSLDVSCEVFYYFDHLVNPPEKIAVLFPNPPLEGTTANNESFSLEIKAGELVGYTWNVNFDFGVINSSSEPVLAEFDEYKNSDKAYADCPLSYFDETTQQMLYEKVGYSGSDLTVIDNLCD